MGKHGESAIRPKRGPRGTNFHAKSIHAKRTSWGIRRKEAERISLLTPEERKAEACKKRGKAITLRNQQKRSLAELNNLHYGHLRRTKDARKRMAAALAGRRLRRFHEQGLPGQTLDEFLAKKLPASHRPWFLVPACLLDTTGGLGLSTYARIPQQQRHCRFRNKTGVLPEFNKYGKRRCCAIQRATGKRCTNYRKDNVLCNFHSQPRIIKLMNLPALQYTMREGKLRSLLQQHINDPHIRDLRGEVGLIKTMLSIQVEQMADLQDLGQISIPTMGQILATTKLLGEMVEKMVNIENKMQSKLSIEQLNEIINRLFDAIIRICAPTEDQCKKLAESIAGIQVIKDVAIAPTYGDDIAHGIEGSTPSTKYGSDGSYQHGGVDMEEVKRRHEAREKHYQTQKLGDILPTVKKSVLDALGLETCPFDAVMG